MLDPVISAALNFSNIDDVTVTQRNGARPLDGCIDCGYEINEGIRRFYLQYKNLPALTSSDVILYAQVRLWKLQTSYKTATVEVHKVQSTWNSSTITWANKPAFDPIIEDYQISRELGYYHWDVTDIVREWYAGTNTGMMFKVNDAVETGGVDNFKQFISSDYTSNTDYVPGLSILFRNNNGLEGYWDYTSSSAGRAGNGYVNDFTGNLVWTRSDIGFGGNRMPVSISHVYNANDSTASSDSNNSNDTAGNYFGLGYGWRTNFHQRVYKWSQDSNYYVWEDADGTDHYFTKNSNGVIVDEDGLELTMTASTSGYTVTDKQGNKSTFDSYGRLTKMENNQATKSSITVTYTTASGPLISKIKDGIGREYRFTYSGTQLIRIGFYANSTSTTELSYVTYGYSGTRLTSITDKDGKSCTYTYSGNLLTSARDIDGYKVQYTYNTTAAGKPSRVSSIREYDGSVAGGHITVSYEHNQTVFTDQVNNTKLIKQFNDFGNTVSVQDEQGRAQYAKYAKMNRTDTAGKGNQLKLSSNLQNTVGSVALDSSFEIGVNWTPGSSAATCTVSSQQAYFGAKSLYVTASAEGYVYGNVFTAGSGVTYTHSAYVKVVSGTASLGIYNGSTIQKGKTLTAGDWVRTEVSYQNTDIAVATLRPVLCLSPGAQVYLDCFQVENAKTASRYNLVESGSFARDNGTFYYGWTTSGSVSMVNLSESCAPEANTRAVRVIGSPTSKSRVTQTVRVSGAAGDTWILSGWAKGNSAPLDGSGGSTRKFSLIATVNHTDGSTEDFEVSFNTDTANWQYAATSIVPKKAYSSVTVRLCYDYNVNTVYFDAIGMFKESFGSSYTYDAKGNVISVKDLQGKTTTYEYSSNDLTKQILPSGAAMTYTYDGYHNVKTATTAEGQTYSFAYDTYGNNTSVSITANGSTIQSTAAYSADGNRMTATTDALGNTTAYSYNAQTNVLEWVQYPEDTPATRTEYTYDSMYRTARVEADTDTGYTLSASYTYADDLLTSIATPSTTYNFTYGSFSNRTAVSIGDRTLASYSYTANNSYLSKLTYGNGDYIDYTYDKYGNLTEKTYEDGKGLTYEYDNNGELARVYDSVTGITTTYYYDFTGRTMRYTEEGPDHSKEVTYGYDDINNLTTQTEVYNGTTRTTSYTYDDDNRVASKTTDGQTVSYTYDSLGRVTTQTTKAGDTVILTESYTYNPNSSQVATCRTQMGNRSLTYSYTYDDNGNILSVNDGSYTTSYVYDSANQLIRENNQAAAQTYTWEYDDAGNVLSQKTYVYSTDTLDTAQSTVSYTYGDEDWGDLLNTRNGKRVTYDEIGNTLTEADWDGVYTWEHGRQLASMKVYHDQWEYTYNADGQRISRTDGTKTYTYQYSGNRLTQMTVDDHTLKFTYDSAGTPVTVNWNGTTYYYMTNLQGDVGGILNSAGVMVASYSYNAWGKIINQSGGLYYDMGDLNPLRYRGYVYDEETSYYYLNSRYYDPISCRFLNADSQISAPGGDVLGYNMFAYCQNNPVNMSDDTGNWPRWVTNLIDSVASTVESIVTLATIIVNAQLTYAGSLPKTGTPGSSATLPNSNGTPKQKRWYGPDGKPERDRDYNHGGDMPFPHDHEWTNGKRGTDHLPPDPSYEFSGTTIAGIGLMTICAVGMAVVAADDLTGFGVADDGLFVPLGSGFIEGIIMIFK